MPEPEGSQDPSEETIDVGALYDRWFIPLPPERPWIGRLSDEERDALRASGIVGEPDDRSCRGHSRGLPEVRSRDTVRFFVTTRRKDRC
jgi:hypothetical protein